MTALTFDLPDELVEAIAARVLERISEQTTAEPIGFLDVTGAAEFLACPASRIYSLVSAERLPVHRDGSRLLFDRGELREYVKRRSEATVTARVGRTGGALSSAGTQQRTPRPSHQREAAAGEFLAPSVAREQRPRDLQRGHQSKVCENAGVPPGSGANDQQSKRRTRWMTQP